ncbi:hypothetical protein ScPMuIL_018179 [Solemya velum]
MQNLHYVMSVIAFTLIVGATASSIRNVLKTNFQGLELIRKRQQDDVTEQEACFSIPHLEALKHQFIDYIDKNGDGHASFEEVEDYLHNYNPEVNREQIDEFIARRDNDGNGVIDFIPDYIMEVSSPDYSQRTAKEWFNLEDVNQDGYVSKDELLKIALNVGMNMEEAEQTVLGYYMRADENGDGKLEWNEYKTLHLD